MFVLRCRLRHRAGRRRATRTAGAGWSRRRATRRTRPTAAGCAPRAPPAPTCWPPPAGWTTALVRAERGGAARPAGTWTRRSPRRPGGCGRSSTSTARTRCRSTSPGRCRWRRSTWRTSWPRASSRTNQIESNSRLCMASAGSGYKLSLGADGPPGSYHDFDHADVFLVIGANMADCHPILFLRMMDRVKAGAKLIVVDPRRTRDRRQGRPVPADPPGHRPGAAQRAAAPAGRERPHRRGVHRRAHRGLGGDAGFLADYPPDVGRGDHRHPARPTSAPPRSGSARPASG